MRTFTVELSIHEIGLIQRALRHAAVTAGATGDYDNYDYDKFSLDVEHLRTRIAEATQNNA